MMVLACNQAPQMQNDAASLITLPHNCDIRVLKSSELLLVPLALPLELLSNLLLQNKSLESIVTLLLSACKTNRKTSVVILLLVDKARQTTVLTLGVINLDLEVLGLLGKGFRKCLELEKL